MMKLARIGGPGTERPVVLSDDGAFDLRPLTDDIDGAFLATNFPSAIDEALAAERLPSVDVQGERFGAPVARPSAVICIGQNYAAHAAESGASPPTQPVIFLKTPNTVVGATDDIRLPPGSLRTDWEVELAVVVGRRASQLAEVDDAAAHIAGYTISNDVSERQLQLEASGGQWSKGKCCPTFNPLGPWLVPARDVLDPQDLRLRSWVNGEPRQDSTTADMIFGVLEIVHHLSQVMTLEPGDVINTGTPEGVALSGRFPYLAPADRLELEIDGLGHQSNAVIALDLRPSVPTLIHE